MRPRRDITNKIFERIIFEGIGRLSLHCFSPSRPGYFDLECESGRADYSIICPNPNCELNGDVDWVDRTPSGSRVYPRAFRLVKSRCPIPALTVDEEIYSRCPSMIISTVDIFNKLASKIVVQALCAICKSDNFNNSSMFFPIRSWKFSLSKSAKNRFQKITLSFGWGFKITFKLG